jgi:hypothetical protein
MMDDSQAGVHDSGLITDVDLEGLPEPIVRYLTTKRSFI